MEKKRKIAIIGAGGIARLINKALLELPDRLEVVGVCDTIAENAGVIAETWKTLGCKVLDTPEALLDVAKPDAVIIATPSHLHVENAATCLKQGIPVLLEKPVGISLDNLSALRALEAKAPGSMGVFQNRYHPDFVGLRRAVRMKRFGKVLSISAMVPWWRDVAYFASSPWKGRKAFDGGGAGMNQGVHQLDMVLVLMAESVTCDSLPGLHFEVRGRVANMAHVGLIDVEDFLFMKLGLGAVTGYFTSTTAAPPGGEWSLTVIGTKGRAVIVNGLLDIWEPNGHADDDDAILEAIKARKQGPAGSASGKSDPLAIGHALHKLQIVDWLDHLDTGTTPGLTLGEASIAPEVLLRFYADPSSGFRDLPGINAT